MTAPPAARPFAASRWTPVAAGVVAAVLVWAVWGAVHPPPLFHDEKAYILEARLLAHLHWTAPSPLLPGFFEQAHVLVVPALASKYFPGNSLALVPGIWLGLPVLIPVLWTGIAGGMLFALARRAANPTVAFFTWFLWVGSKDNLTWRTTYFSELLCGTCVLVAWWALWRWRETRRPWTVVAGAAAIALCGITRPLTGIAYAIPFIAVVAWDTIRGRHWRAGVLAAVAGLAIGAVVPVWSAETTGSWRETPLARYSADYMPYDHLGFGADTTPPRRAVPADLADLNDFYLRLHRMLVPRMLPRIAWWRFSAIAVSVWGALRWVLLPFAVLALVALSREAAFALSGAALHFVLYLTYAHPPQWTLYYVELYPVLAFLSAWGVWLALRAAQLRTAPWRLPSAAAATDAPLLTVPRPVLTGFVLLTLAILWPTLTGIASVSGGARESRAFFRTYLDRIDAAPERPALVFVHYRDDHNPSVSFIQNDPDPDTVAVLTAYDRGDDDVRLIRAMPGRTPYVFDEGTLQLFRIHLPPDTVAARSSSRPATPPTRPPP